MSTSSRMRLALLTCLVGMGLELLGCLRALSSILVLVLNCCELAKLQHSNSPDIASKTIGC